MFVPGFMCTQSIPGPAKYTTNKKCLRPGQGWLVSVLEMFMFAQLISRPELTFLMKSGYVSVIRVPGPKIGDI